MKATIRSIAKAAGVSRGTVDRALNDKPGVSRDVSEKIKKIAAEMGYKPNLAGKALAYQKNPLKIGVITLSKDDPFFQEAYEGVSQASNEFKGFGVTVECRFMDKVDAQEQLICIRELYSKNISALVIPPLDEEFIRTELNKLAAENIKIVTYNTDITGIERLCFVGQDARRSGRVAGGLIGKLLPNGGNVMIINGPEKIKALQERVEGFKEVICARYPDINISHILHNVNDNDTAYNKTIEVLKSRDLINAIYITARGIGGVGRAIRELGKSNIKFVCFDKISETLKLIEDEIIDFTITQEPFMQGYLPIKLLFEYFFHNNLPSGKQQYTRLEILTKENIY